jgi:hypothetical protein
LECGGVSRMPTLAEDVLVRGAHVAAREGMAPGRGSARWDAMG